MTSALQKTKTRINYFPLSSKFFLTSLFCQILSSIHDGYEKIIE
jgi:hypothetical protein